MTGGDREKFAGLLEELTTLFDIELRVGRGQLYWDSLATFSYSVVEEAARELRTTCKRFPALAEWHERCRAVATRRARPAAAVNSSEPNEPLTWNASACIVLTHAALAGVQLSDPATRDRALELVLDELRELRELFNAPADVPRARRVAERRRIVQLLVQQRAGDVEPAPSSECSL